MTDSQSADRRRDVRVPVALPVELVKGSDFLLFSSSDLSMGGAFFSLAIPHPIGAQVQVTLRLPGEAPIRCLGEVVNVPDRGNFGMGVRFIDMAEADKTRLSDFLEAQRSAP